MKTVEACFGRDLRGVSESSSYALVRRNLFIDQAKRLNVGPGTIGHHLNLRLAPTAIQQRLRRRSPHPLVFAVTHQMHQRLDRLRGIGSRQFRYPCLIPWPATRIAGGAGSKPACDCSTLLRM